MHLSAAQIDLCVIMALIANKSIQNRTTVCVYMEGKSAAETKPPNPGAPTSSGPPTAMQGYDAPSPGECAVLLQDAAPLCLPNWVAGWLAGCEWKSERVRACFCAVSKPPVPLAYPQHGELVVPASTHHSTNQAVACLLIMWYPSDSQRGAYGFPVQCSMLIGQQGPL